MRIAFSPCPNDTFLFHGWVSGESGGPKVDATLADIQQLNELAKEGTYDLIKVSCASLPPLLDEYRVLPIGAAIGYGCGPLLVAKKPFPLEALSLKRVAIPGEGTTAHRLLNRVAPSPSEKTFCAYHEVDELLSEGVVDAAVVIHEMRFTFQEKGYELIADLGALWEERFQVAVPLGCLIAKPPVCKDAIVALQRSLAHAYAKCPMAYIKQHAQELEERVIRKHIALYVTEETANLTPKGLSAISYLIEKPASEFVYATDCLCPSP